MPNNIKTESSLYNGISQQNPELRLPSQVTNAVNTKLSVVHGVEKRPAAQLISRLENSSFAAQQVAPIDIDENNRFLLILGNSNRFAYDLEGTPIHLEYEDGDIDDYLTIRNSEGTINATRDFRLTTVLATTIITNRNAITSLGGSTTPDLATDQYLWIANGVQQVARKVVLNGTNTWQMGKESENDTRAIADDFEAWVNARANYTAVRITDSIVQVINSNGTPFTMVASDSYGDTTMKITPCEGVKFDQLTPTAADNAIVKIIGEEQADANYYLQFDLASKSWSEVPGPGIQTEIDNTTMPVKLTLEIDTDGSVTGTVDEKYLYFSKIDYATRVTGDVDSSPNPSFIGQSINDVFYFKNRMGFLSGESIICSVTDDVFNFWPKTVKEVLEDDPIDIAVSTTKTTSLEFATLFPDSMAIFGTNQQYSLSSGDKVFAAENVQLEATTSYDISILAKPQNIGASVYMLVPQDSYSSMREYTVLPDTLITDAVDATGHTPRLLPSTIKQMIPEKNLETLFLIDRAESDTELNSIWVYNFYYEGNEKVQSAWSEWKVWFTPIGGATFDGKLYLIGKEYVDSQPYTILVRFGLDTKSVEVESGSGALYKNPEPLIDRLSLLSDSAVSPETDSIVIEVSLEQYEALDMDNVAYTLVDRTTGVAGDFLEKYIDSGSYFARFDMVASANDDAWSPLSNFLLGEYPIGGNF